MTHARYDGSLPPSPRRSHEDAYAAERAHSRRHFVERERLDQRRQELVDELDALDVEVEDWIRRRRVVVANALELHETLWPRVPAAHVVRPPRPDGWPVVPLSAAFPPLWGPHLRTWCLDALRKHGPCSLPELRTLVRLHGLDVAGRNVPKVLSDALRVEVAAGRAMRVRRGHYDAR